MHSKLENWNNGWFGVELGLKRAEIDSIISLLEMLKKDPDQHFHLSSDYKAEGGLGDVTIYLQSDESPSNMEQLGQALAPGDEI